jgi:hypothetical protein
MERDKEPLTVEELCFALEQHYCHNAELSTILKLLRRSPEAFNEALSPHREHCTSLRKLYKSFGLEYVGLSEVRRQIKSFTKTLLTKELKHFV